MNDGVLLSLGFEENYFLRLIGERLMIVNRALQSTNVTPANKATISGIKEKICNNVNRYRELQEQNKTLSRMLSALNERRAKLESEVNAMPITEGKLQLDIERKRTALITAEAKISSYRAELELIDHQVHNSTEDIMLLKQKADVNNQEALRQMRMINEQSVRFGAIFKASEKRIAFEKKSQISSDLQRKSADVQECIDNLKKRKLLFIDNVRSCKSYELKDYVTRFCDGWAKMLALKDKVQTVREQIRLRSEQNRIGNERTSSQQERADIFDMDMTMDVTIPIVPAPVRGEVVRRAEKVLPKPVDPAPVLDEPTAHDKEMEITSGEDVTGPPFSTSLDVELAKQAAINDYVARQSQSIAGMNTAAEDGICEDDGQLPGNESNDAMGGDGNMEVCDEMDSFALSESASCNADKYIEKESEIEITSPSTKHRKDGETFAAPACVQRNSHNPIVETRTPTNTTKNFAAPKNVMKFQTASPVPKCKIGIDEVKSKQQEHTVTSKPSVEVPTVTRRASLPHSSPAAKSLAQLPKSNEVADSRAVPARIENNIKASDNTDSQNFFANISQPLSPTQGLDDIFGVNESQSEKQAEKLLNISAHSNDPGTDFLTMMQNPVDSATKKQGSGAEADFSFSLFAGGGEAQGNAGDDFGFDFGGGGADGDAFSFNFGGSGDKSPAGGDNFFNF